MTLIQDNEQNKPFIYINGGKLKKSVEEGEAGAVKREWTIPAKGKEAEKSGVKWEISYKSIKGIIQKISFHDGDFGRSLNVEFDDATLTMNTNSRYFSDFVQKLASADITQEVLISPYDYEKDGRRIIGVSVWQNNESLVNYFYDYETRTQKNGMPAPTGDVKKYNSDKWKIYFLTQKQFLEDYVENVLAKNVQPEELEYVTDTSQIAQELGGEIVNVSEIPF